MFTTLIFDEDMIEFLSISRPRKISEILLHGDTSLISDVGNFIMREDGQESDVLSYLPTSKLVKVRECSPYEKGIGRVKIKIGRFLRKFLNQKSFESFSITDKDIEDFVNSYKSYFNTSVSDIKIVEGSEILKWYLEKNYFIPNDNKIGTLWNSCMRYENRNKFLHLYSRNPNIKMAVLLVDGKVRTRALLWYDVKDREQNEYKVMDRIYSVYDHDTILFKKWASENGFIPKYYQNAKSEGIFDLGGLPVKRDFTVSIENYDFAYYPYLDTFKYFNLRNGTLSNSSYSRYDYCLIQSNGALEPEPEPEPDDQDDY